MSEVVAVETVVAVAAIGESLVALGTKVGGMITKYKGKDAENDFIAIRDELESIKTKYREEINRLEKESDDYKNTSLDLKQEVEQLKEIIRIEESEIEYYDEPYITLKSRRGMFCANCWRENHVLSQLYKKGDFTPYECNKCPTTVNLEITTRLSSPIGQSKQNRPPGF